MKTLATVLAIGVLFAAPAQGQWNESRALFAEDGSQFDYLGTTAALSGRSTVLGASQKSAESYHDGAAYVFDSNSGVQQFRLTPDDWTDSARFGESVAVFEDTILIGAPHHIHDGIESGAAYLFDATTGAQVRELLPSDGQAGDRFGISVAIIEDFAFVGAPLADAQGSDTGAVYVFDTATGQQLATLTPDDHSTASGFGVSIDARGTLLIVGATYAEGSVNLSGAAYLFDTSSGQQLVKLFAGDGQPRKRFGSAVALGDGFVAIGAEYEDNNGIFAGAVYLFELATGNELFKLQPDNSDGYQFFGEALAFAGDTLLVGASGDENFSGSLYRFDTHTGEQLASLVPSDTHSGQCFGGAVAANESTIIVGAYGDSPRGFFAGAGYVFPTFCPADWNRDRVADSRDVLAFLSDWIQDEPAADVNGDGVIDTRDFIAFLGIWAAGCG